MPGGVIPNQYEHVLALHLDVFTQPLQKIGGHLADRASRNEAQVHAATASGKHPVTSQRLGIKIVLGNFEFLQMQWLVLFTPTVQVGLAHSAPPHLIEVAHLPSIALRQGDQGVTPLFLPGILWIGTGDPVFRSLLPDPMALESLSNGFDTHLTHRQALVEADLCGQRERPKTGRFAEYSWTLMQQSSQRFTFGLVKLCLHGFWPTRLGLETLQALLLKSMNRITHRLGSTS